MDEKLRQLKKDLEQVRMTKDEHSTMRSQLVEYAEHKPLREGQKTTNRKGGSWLLFYRLAGVAFVLVLLVGVDAYREADYSQTILEDAASQDMSATLLQESKNVSDEVEKAEEAMLLQGDESATRVAPEMFADDREVLEVKHSFASGVHTFTGTIDIPTPCHAVNVLADKDNSVGDVTITLITQKPDPDLVCIQVIDQYTFEVDVAGDESTQLMGVVLDGEEQVLEIIEAN